MKHCITFLLLLCTIYTLPAQLFLNEWMSSNSSTITDADFDNSGDWIEVFNASDNSIDLSGYFLTDDLSEPAKWHFPNNTQIAPNGFLLVWADGENTGLHTAFKLTKEGEEIGLFDRDTLLLDSIIYAQQVTDISMGRATDGNTEIGFFTTPTPGMTNDTPVFEGISFYQPRFSIRGGFYESDLELTLSAIEGTIRYTLDGSLPTWEAPEYTTPIIIEATTNVRAAVFIENFVPSRPVTHTYFINEDFKTRGLPVVSISGNPADFWSEETGLYVQDFKPDWEYPINIELFENDGSDRAAFNELAGTKVNGLNSWQLPQKMLGIYFDNEYDKNNLDYPLFFDRNRKQYDNFILRASGSDWSFTLFRDGLCQGLTDETMDLERSGFRPAIAFINGEYMGIHNLRSRVDEGFIEDNFGYSNEEYDLIENNGEVEEGDTVAFNHLINLLNNDLSQDANFQLVEELMDMENLMDFFITEIWTSNSSYGHNIQIWKPKSGGKWRWILQDFDRGFTGSDNNGIDYFISTGQNGYTWIRTIFRSLLENENFAQAFAARFADHLYVTFHPERVTEQIMERKAAIQREIAYHVERWAGTTSSYGNGIPSVNFWENEVNKLITFAQERQGFMVGDLQNHFGLEEATNLGMMLDMPEAGHLKINDLVVPRSAWNGVYFQNLSFELKAVAQAGHEFEGWSTATYETLIPKEAEWKYLDDGSNQGTAWRNLNFSDASWQIGRAELGYGDGDENTTLSFGNDAGDKHPTTYFRKTFQIENLSDYPGSLVINLKRDDGAVVYLNGIELLRTNIPDGDIDFQTYALDFVAGASEAAFMSFSISGENLVEGENVLAVELHQATPNSSDISFDLELKALRVGEGDYFSTSAAIDVQLSQDTFFVAHFSPTGECVLPAEIAENTVLTLDCSPYFAVQNVHILENIELTVEAGVEIHFSENAGFMVNGSLQVQGTETQPVIFKNKNESEQWSNINFQFTTDTSRLEWLEIIGASKGRHPIHEKAAISAFHADLELNHVFLENIFAEPIFAQYSDIELRSSRLHCKVIGDLINVKYGNALIDSCDFKGNQQPDTDAIDYDEVENGIIRNSKIYDFLGFNSDGIDLGEESFEVLIENNFIHNCTDKAISVGQSSSIIAQNNTIVNCYQGFGIKDLGTAEIDQITFYNTAIPIACFEKNVGSGGGMAFVSNSIFSNSPEMPYFQDDHSFINIHHSLSDTDGLFGSTNLFTNPEFENPTLHDFRLKASSPAIGAGWNGLGTDLDLGTKSHLYTAKPSVLISAIHYNPAEDADAEFLQLYNPASTAQNLSGYTFTEGIDFVFPNIELAPYETLWLVKDASLFPDITAPILEWTSGKLSNAGETLRLVDANGIVIDQVTYDDQLPWPNEADGEGHWLTLISSDLDNHFALNWEINEVVSTEELKDEIADFSIFPNPARDFVQIESEEEMIKQIVIFDALGREWRRFEVNNQLVRLDLGNLPKGIYWLEINGKQSKNWDKNRRLLIK